MDVKMKQADKMAQARAEAMKAFDVEGKGMAQVGVGEFAMETAFGFVKVKFTAVKAEDFDVAQAAEDFAFDQEAKRVAKANKDAEKKMKADMRAAEKAKNAKA